MTASETARTWTIVELAERWGCNSETVRDLISSRKLKHFRVGRLIRVTQAALDQYEQGKKEKA